MHIANVENEIRWWNTAAPTWRNVIFVVIYAILRLVWILTYPAGLLIEWVLLTSIEWMYVFFHALESVMLWWWYWRDGI